jgi:hypothetical protein
MLSLKSGITKSHLFQFVSTLIVISLIVIAEMVLIGENAAFLETQGKSRPTAVALAACVALLIPVVPGLRIGENGLLIKIVKWFFVSSLITMQVYFASQTAIAPELKKIATTSDTEIIKDYRSQLAQYDNQIQIYQKHIDSFPESFRTKRAELSRHQLKLIEGRRKVLADLQAVSQKTSANLNNVSGLFQHLTIMITIIYRLALEIGVVLLTSSLRKQFSPQEIERSDDISQPPIDEPIQKDEPEKIHLTPKKYVLSIYPLAYCKSKNGRKGPYVIYLSQESHVEFAKAKGTSAAWQTAVKKLKKGTVLQQQNTRSNTNFPDDDLSQKDDPPKVYAIKS